ncbi:MAG: DUF2953 domain-containing protein [Eubacterium sp.]|nr:DUF2953 domain-containing protein [Eubacterium sp.]
MKVFLIILAVIVLLLVIVLSLSAEFTIIFDNGWTTKVKVLFIEKDVKLSQLLSFIVLPDKAGAEAAEASKEKKKAKADEDKKEPAAPKKDADKQEPPKEQPSEGDGDKKTAAEPPEVTSVEEEKESDQPKKKPKPNFIKKILDEDGVVGLMLFLSNVLQTLNSAVNTLIKGLHIYSLYVKMIIGGGDAADIGQKYGSMCGWYYPLKGLILNQMRVDNYDDLIQPDFIAPRSEYEFQLIGSLSVGALVKVLLKAGKVFVINYLKNK